MNVESPSAAPQLCKYSLYSCTVKNPHRSDLHRLHEHQTHACASSMTCALIWLVTGAALHQKRAASIKVLRLNIHRMKPTGRLWVRARVCVQPEPRTTAALFYSPTLSRTDRSATQEAAQDLPAVFISQGWIMSRVRAVGSVQLCLINICLSMRMWSAIITRVYYYQCLRIVKLRCVLHKHFTFSLNGIVIYKQELSI